jgi:hypothetical protein
MNKNFFRGSLLLSVFFLTTFFVSAETSTVGVNGTSITPVSVMEGDVDTTETSTCLELKSTNLRYRSTDATTGGEVSDLQDFLVATSFLKTQVTGFFGLGTFNAVKMFQKSSGLNPTGYVGTLTKAKIKEQSCNGLQIMKGEPSPVSDGQEINPQNTYNPKNDTRTTSAKKCSMEARLCLDGRMMARNPYTCEWIPSSCVKPEPMPPVTKTSPVVACTMEARLCPDGKTMMPRDNSCVWHPEKCGTAGESVSDGQEINPYNTYNPKSGIGSTTPPKMCTMEARLCPDGKTMVPRDSNCVWYPEKCPSFDNGGGMMQTY